MMGSSRTDYSALLAELTEAIEQDQIFVCRDLLVDIDKGEQKGNAVIQKYFEENKTKLESVRANIDKVTELLDKLKSEQGWTRCNHKKDVTVYFQKVEGSPFLMTKVETFFPGQLHELPRMFVRLISFFNESDLLPRWYPRNLMKGSDLIYQISNFSKIIDTKIAVPPPISMLIGPRQCTLVGRGFDMSERKNVVITVGTEMPGAMVEGFQVPQLDKGYTQLFLEAVFFFELKNDGIVVKFMQLVNINTSLVPAPIMNWLSKGQLPFEYVAKLKSNFSHYDGSVWEERVKAQPHIYKEIEKRLLRCLEREMNFVAKPLNEAEGPDDAELDNMSISSAAKKKLGFGFSTGSSRRFSISKRFSSLRKKTKAGNSVKRQNSRTSSRLSRSLSSSRRSFGRGGPKVDVNKVELYDKVVSDKSSAVVTVSTPGSVYEWLLYVLEMISALFSQAVFAFAQQRNSLARRYPSVFGSLKED